ncbi:MAG: DUF4394 domain-containing protein [Oculatellaceae cyanobacterium Prado106]|nr:DUF4394 domain-containing protein [Oculatellaceae cyanobacterium Prado106]
METSANLLNSSRNLGRLKELRLLTGSLNAENKTNLYRFRVTELTRVRSSLDGLRGGNGDLELLGSDRQRLAQSKRRGTRAELIEQTLEPGQYFVRVRQRSGETGYRLRLSATPFILPDLAGNSRERARQVNVSATPSSFVDSVGLLDDNDFYRFEVTTPGNLNLALNALTNNADVQVLNNTGQVVVSSSNPGNTAESLNVNLASGTYFARVFPKDRFQGTSYSLNLAVTPLSLFGLTEQNTLVAFNANNSNAVNVATVNGLAGGDRLVGIDFRPTTATDANGRGLNGTLYGLGQSNRLYTIDLTNGRATPVGNSPFAPGLDGDTFGVDFNPAPDRLRVVSNREQNLRLNPDTGAIVDSNMNAADGIQIDTPLAYITGDTNAGRNPNIVATAYANNRPGGRTTQFVIDADLDILARQGSPGGNPASPFGGSPNGGLLTTIGALGFDFSNNAAFDITTDGTGADMAIATSGSTLYGINLATGAARNLGTVTFNGNAVNIVGLSSRMVG